MSFVTLNSPWQERRSAFNHDWLKNKYLNGLKALIERLQSSKPNRERLVEYLSVRLPAWETHRHEARWLIEAFEAEMSPLRLFEEPPLNRCDAETAAWLGPLVHGLWLARYPVKEQVQAVEEAFKAADNQYEELRQVLTRVEEMDTEQLVSLLPQLQAFRDACTELTRSISLLPGRILVT